MMSLSTLDATWRPKEVARTLDALRVTGGTLTPGTADLLRLAAHVSGAVMRPHLPGCAELVVAKAGGIAVAATADAAPARSRRFSCPTGSVGIVRGGVLVDLDGSTTVVADAGIRLLDIAGLLAGRADDGEVSLLPVEDDEGRLLAGVAALVRSVRCPPRPADAVVPLAIYHALREGSAVCRVRDGRPKVGRDRATDSLRVVLDLHGSVPFAGPVAAVGGSDALVAMLPWWIAMADAAKLPAGGGPGWRSPTGVVVAASPLVLDADAEGCAPVVGELLTRARDAGRPVGGLMVAGEPDARYAVALYRRGVVVAEAFDTTTGRRVPLAAVAKKRAA